MKKNLYVISSFVLFTLSCGSIQQSEVSNTIIGQKCSTAQGCLKDSCDRMMLNLERANKCTSISTISERRIQSTGYCSVNVTNRAAVLNSLNQLDLLMRETRRELLKNSCVAKQGDAQAQSAFRLNVLDDATQVSLNYTTYLQSTL